MEKNEVLYIIDPAKYNGIIVNTGRMVDGEVIADYSGGLTLEQYKERKGNPNLIALEFEEFYDRHYKPHIDRLQGEFKEISEKQYYDSLECLPPKKWHDLAEGINVFFVGECVTADLYSCCLKVDGRHYSALRSIYVKVEVLLEQALKLRQSGKQDSPMYKVGQKIKAFIDYANETIEGTIIGIGDHRGRRVYDLDCNRYLYEKQIVGVI